MPSVPKTCIDCGDTSNNTRCDSCQSIFDYKRNNSPTRLSYKEKSYKALARGGVCWLCGRGGADTLDHLVPISKGGTNAPSNLRPAHRKCNSQRGNKTIVNRLV